MAIPPKPVSFRLSPAVAKAFSAWCRARGVKRKAFVEALLIHGMTLDGTDRDRLLEQAEKFLAQHQRRKAP